MKLIEPTIEYDRQLQAYRAEFLSPRASMDGGGSLIRFDDTGEWLRYVALHKKRDTVPDGHVPATQFIYVRESDDKVVGMIQIRHCLNDYLSKYAGHIGYSVAPSERRKGYAAEMLRLSLPYCRDLGLDGVMISCVKGNEGSRRTILKNGGVYEKDVYESDKDVYLEIYRVDLSRRTGRDAVWIVAGDEMKKLMEAASPEKEIVPFREDLSRGPVPGFRTDREFIAARAAFWGVSEDEYKDKTAPIAGIDPSQECVLCFGEDDCCRANLRFMKAYLKERGYALPLRVRIVDERDLSLITEYVEIPE